MTGVVMAAHFDDGLIARHLARLALLDSQGFVRVREEVGEYLVADVQDNIDGQRLFDGSPMPQSAASRGRKGGYVKSKKTGREYYNKNLTGAGKTLLDSRRLSQGYVYQLTDTGLEVGNALVYAAIHHFGGETGSKGHRFMLPARPVLGIAARQERELGDLFIAELQRAQP